MLSNGGSTIANSRLLPSHSLGDLRRRHRKPNAESSHTERLTRLCYCNGMLLHTRQTYEASVHTVIEYYLVIVLIRDHNAVRIASQHSNQSQQVLSARYGTSGIGWMLGIGLASKAWER